MSSVSGAFAQSQAGTGESARFSDVLTTSFSNARSFADGWSGDGRL
jgi:hypothetical protein